MSRLVLDVSSLLSWSGPPAGIVRVEHALATAALRRPGTVLAFYDADLGSLRSVDPKWQHPLIGWSAALDRHRTTPRRGWRRIIPGRHHLVVALERLRLTASHPALARAADLAQRAVLSIRRHQFPLLDASGHRVGIIPRDLALGPPLDLGPTDTVMTAGSAWSDTDPARMVTLKRRHGFRYAVLCYDLIPATHPHFYPREMAQQFVDYWAGVLPVVDRVIVNSACIAADIGWFCTRRGISPPATQQLPLGFDPPAHTPPARLPDPLTQGAFALFVSTIEPRKGHAVLLRAWRRLLARGIPQQTGFRLVFVGRPGWLVDDVLDALADPDALQNTVLHFDHASDAILAALYQGAAFCLYPSVYEGFGLPIIEAYARGKPVLASSGGAVPETAGALSPALDPYDDTAWEAAMEDWILHPGSRPTEAEIRAAARYSTWPEAASRILDAAQGLPEPKL